MDDNNPTPESDDKAASVPAAVADLSPEAQELIAACNLVRSAGHAVMPQHEFDLWSHWLRQAHDTSRANDDAYILALQQMQWLEDRVREHLNGSRPAWWRRHLKGAKAVRSLRVERTLGADDGVLSGPATSAPSSQEADRG